MANWLGLKLHCMRSSTLLIAGLLFALSAAASDLALMPVRIVLKPNEDRAALTLTNQGNDPVVMQVEPVSWTQVDGQDR